MVAHEVFVNGQRVCLAGIESGVFHTIIGWSGGRDRGDHLDVRIGGLDNQSNEHLGWPPPAIGIGDEILVKVVRVAAVDPPTRREPSKRRNAVAECRRMLQLYSKDLTPKQRRVLLKGLIRELRQLDDEAEEG